MYSKTLVALASAALLGSVVAEDAKVVNDNPHGVTFSANLPEKPFFAPAEIDGNVRGSISATAADNGVGTKFSVHFSNLPKSGGPFIYHLHVKPATGGNCTATLGHLDPTHRMDQPPCDASKPETCQVGDLSGKYGKITTDPFTAEFTDPYTSLEPGNPAFFGNASFVIHYANATRLTCADFSKSETSEPSQPDCSGGAQPTGGNVSPPGQTGTNPSKPTGPVTVPPITAGASKLAIAAPLAAFGAALMI